jgi:Secretion system C-terminal sorting domain
MSKYVRMRIWVPAFLAGMLAVPMKSLVSQDIQVSETGHAHFGASIASDSSGDYVVVWSDTRDSTESDSIDGSSIYGQSFSSNGARTGINFRISGENPHASDSQIWGDVDIFARAFGGDGLPIGPPFRVSDDTGNTAQIDPKVLVRANGSFVVTWLDRREGPLFSYAQLYDSLGIAEGANFKVNTNGVEGVADIGGFEDGRFFFYWSGHLQLFDADGLPISEVFDIGKHGLAAAIGADSIILIWQSNTFPNTDIFCRLYSTTGLALSDSLKIDMDDSIPNPIGRIAVSRSIGGDIIIVWGDHRNDRPGAISDGDIYAQRFDRWMRPLGTNFKVNHELRELPQRDPAVTFSKGNFVAVWTENQSRATCPLPPPGVYFPPETVNIVATIQMFEDPIPGQVLGWQTKSKCPQPPPPSKSSLMQNYPNPFNMETVIPFEVAEEGFVSIFVYDLQGRLVKPILSTVVPPGSYAITFRPSGLSSGVYFYRFSTKGIDQVQRMTLVR